MIVDGRRIAEEIKQKLKEVVSQLKVKPMLDVVVVGEDLVVENFVRIKLRFGEEIGISVILHHFPTSISQVILEEEILKIISRSSSHGLIVQLPLPIHISSQKILDLVPPSRDVDVLSTAAIARFAQEKSPILPPVAGAIYEILHRSGVVVSNKEVLVLGHGRLVGIPATILLRQNNAHVTVIDRPLADLRAHTHESHVIISGVGKPGLITPDMLSHGVVLIDAGTSEAGGKIVGDVHPDCAPIASVFTPVPGGVGPITVAMLFKNLLILQR